MDIDIGCNARAVNVYQQIQLAASSLQLAVVAFLGLVTVAMCLDSESQPLSASRVVWNCVI